jgi:hypothetical protein
MPEFISALRDGTISIGAARSCCGLVGSAVRHPVAGALVGGALGAGGGALIGNQLQGQEEVQAQQQEEINRQNSELRRQRENFRE